MASNRGITLFIVSLNMTESSDLKNHLFISSRTRAYFFSRDLIFTVWIFLACLSGSCNEIQEKQLFWLVWVWTGPGWTELGQTSGGSRSHVASAVKPPTKRGSCHGHAFTVVMRGREDTGWGVPDHLAEFIKTLMRVELATVRKPLLSGTAPKIPPTGKWAPSGPASCRILCDLSFE